MNRTTPLLAILLAGVYMGTLDIAIVSPCLQPIGEEFGVTSRLVSWVFTIFILFNQIGNPIMARLSDLFGRKRIYIIDILLFGTGSVIVALAPSFVAVLAGRAIQGFGSGGIFPVVAATIGDIYPIEKRGTPLGIMGFVIGLAFITGPGLAGILLLVHWRWVFVVNLPLAIGIAVCGARTLPSGRFAKWKRLDWPGILLLSMMLTSLAIGVNRIDTSRFIESVLSVRVLPLLLVVLGSFPLLFVRERRARSPLLAPSLFHIRQLSLAYLISFGSGYVQASMIFIPAFTVLAFGVTPSTAGFLLVPLVSVMAVSAPAAGILLDRAGSRAVIATGAAVLAVGMLLLAVFTDRWHIFFIAVILIGAGLSVLFGAPVRYVTINAAPPDERSTAQAVGNLFSGTGQTVSSALIGAMISSFGGGMAGYRIAYGLAGAIAVIILFLSFALRGKRGERRENTATLHEKVPR